MRYRIYLLHETDDLKKPRAWRAVSRSFDSRRQINRKRLATMHAAYERMVGADRVLLLPETVQP